MTELNQIGANARHAIDDTVGRLADVATQVASQVADKFELTGEQLKDTQSRVASCCRGYVREKPLTSLGIAVASGFLLSWALRQR